MLVAGVAPGGLIQLYNTLLLERSLVDLQTNQSEDGQDEQRQYNDVTQSPNSLHQRANDRL